MVRIVLPPSEEVACRLAMLRTGLGMTQDEFAQAHVTRLGILIGYEDARLHIPVNWLRRVMRTVGGRYEDIIADEAAWQRSLARLLRT